MANALIVKSRRFRSSSRISQRDGIVADNLIGRLGSKSRGFITNPMVQNHDGTVLNAGIHRLMEKGFNLFWIGAGGNINVWISLWSSVSRTEPPTK